LNNKNIIPISAQTEIELVSRTFGKNENCGTTKKPASIYPKTTGCLSFLKIIVVIPAMTRIKARSVIMDGK
jgi:hypothetical protein